jgi:glycine cleavage system H protein
MAHTIFLTAFYSVVAAITITVAAALVRSVLALGRGQAAGIRWQSDFHDLPAADRDCRHVLTGEFASRKCPNAFDCRRCATHARWIEQHPPAAVAEPEEDVYGMSFPLDRFYHRGHTWARPEADGTVTVGLDDLGRRLLGAPDALALPAPGTRLVANGPAFRVRKRGADVRVLSPVDGDVVETAGTGRDWLLRVKPAGGVCDSRHLLSGWEVRPWLTRELERLQLTLSPDGASPSLADGGVPVADIAAQYPGADWDAVCGEMFLEP